MDDLGISDEELIYPSRPFHTKLLYSTNLRNAFSLELDLSLIHQLRP